MVIRMVRFAYAPFGTYGKLFVPGWDKQLWTVECPWEMNEPSISCIPEGRYTFARGTWNRDPGPDDDLETFEIEDVPGRSQIKLHPANFPSDLSGCVGVGTGLASRGHEWGVSNSREAHAMLMQFLDSLLNCDIVVSSPVVDMEEFHG